MQVMSSEVQVCWVVVMVVWWSGKAVIEARGCAEVVGRSWYEVKDA